MKGILICFIIPIMLTDLAAITINIPGDYPTIQAGILASSDHDTILVQPGTYFENIDFMGHKVVLASMYFLTNDSSYIENTIIDGNSDGSVVSFLNREDSTTIICGFTITNGLNDSGGGIYCYNSSPLIEHNKISGNTGDSGGGIFCNHASAKIIENFISDNTIFVPLGNPGGGIFCNNGSNCLIMKNIITDNLNQDGAGICCYSSNPIIMRNVIYNNQAFDLGGGFRIDYCSPTILNNTIWGNSASSGGGMCINSNSSPVITNNIFWNNSAFIGQDEIQSNGGSPQITYCDVQGGWAGTGNLNINPLLTNPNHGFFQLLPTSPVIDAGDPNSPPDPDGTIADIGAFYFDQSSLAIQDVVITVQGNDIHLQWSPVPIAVNYKIYASENPYFTPAPELLIGTSTAPEFTHQNIVPEGQCFYRIVYEY